MDKKIEMKVPFPGPKTLKILEDLKKYESRGDLCFANYGIPPVIEEAEGCFVKDVDGNTYLDLTGGFAALNLGHCPQEVIEAVYSQMKKVHHTAQQPTEIRVKLAKKLVEIAPGKLRNNSKVQFDTGGTNAVEVGMKLAKAYTKRPYILCYSGAYHGRSFGTLAVTCFPFLKENFFPIMPGGVRIPYPYCYRCPFGREYPSCELFCVKYIENLFSDPAYGLIDRKKGTNLVAGLLFEPAQGAGGYIIPPDGYWQKIRKLCDEYDILMIDDEIQMGWGRSGKMFAIEAWGVTPDIIMAGKAFTAGVFPNAAIIARTEIMDVFKPIHQSVTFSGNPVGSAAVLAMLETLEKKDLLKNACRMGEYFLEKLKELQNKHKLIGCVQGKGLMLSMEFVRDRETKEPASEETIGIIKEAIKRGLLLTISGHFGNRLNIVPPLIITKEEIDMGIKILDEVIGLAEEN
ncbi:aspartate aminotransferase family protein [Candidatus Calescamantes bacterium]|nr:aspartate aminotransferase family protein [Candidatus Calescamantes bacterium]